MKKVLLFSLSICILTSSIGVIFFVYSNQPKTHHIALTEDGFSPKTLRIKKGATVTWKNNSDATGTVDSDPHPVHTSHPPLNLGRIPQGESDKYNFSKPGTFMYHDHYHPERTGIITVD